MSSLTYSGSGGGGVGIITLSATTGSATGSVILVQGTNSNIVTSASGSTFNIALANSPSVSGSVTAGTGFVATTGGITFSDFSAGSLVTDSSGVTSSVNGISGYVLTSNGAGVAPSFQAASATSNLNVSLITFADTPYFATASDQFIGVDSTGGPITILLPTAPTVGRTFIIKDVAGDAENNNIEIQDVSGVDSFDNIVNFTINSEYQAANLVYVGSNNYYIY